MADTGLSEAVKTFITEHISSVEQLEVLLLLQREQGEWWSAQAVSEALRIEPGSAGERLADLEGRGLLVAQEEGGERLYQYRPQQPQLDGAVSELVRAYQDYRVTVISLIFSKPIDKIRTFADAFKFRKDKGDG